MEKKSIKPTKALLIKKLMLCISEEKYELAAELRDLIKELYGTTQIR